jgi:Flp pilus assembly protein TadD
MALLLNPGASAVRNAYQARSERPKPATLAEGVRPGKQALSVSQNYGQGARLQKSGNRVRSPDLSRAQDLIERGDLDRGWEIVDRLLRYENPDDPLTLTVGAQCQMKAGRLTVAYQFARRAAELAPDNSYCWSNLSMMQDQLYQFDDAEDSCRMALSTARDDAARGAAYLNWGCMLVNRGFWVEAEPIARKALELKPDSAKAKANLGMSLLGQGNYAQGWPLYDAVIGFDKSRRKVQYAKEPVWDGTKGQRIVVYGEQGLGDEISFASMLPDAIRDSASVVIDCDAKLEGLFKRSFPKARVYGTRWEANLGWPKQDTEIDASISIGALGKFYRPTPQSCPGTPYLVPDPERVAMWRGLFGSFGKPVIGIGWTGGVPWTADRFRKWTLEDLLPVFKSTDAVFVSLQYKDAAAEIAAFRERHGVDIRQYKHATLTNDYDDTVAMVAALDMVFSMQSAVIHAAGAIGKECWCFVNKCPQWRYGIEGEKMPWYESVRLFRQAPDGSWPIERAAKELAEKFK